MVIASLAFVLAATAGSGSEPACIVPDGSRLQLELALTEREKKAGLMFRDSLPSDHGMLFTFDSDGLFSFWMKNTLMPLDIVWIDAVGKVVEVHPNAPPCHVDPCPKFTNAQGARAVLLVNAGYSHAHGVAAGSLLRFENARFPAPPPHK